ncbi:MAG: hypothetical protein INR65_19750 [Gluconacetobacter diazotrophicus]|nr:hypothetical protein [Gluconacetobacter diazotrophicus]
MSEKNAAAPVRAGRRRFRRRAATLAARCAMASWVVLAAMPVVAVVVTLS